MKNIHSLEGMPVVNDGTRIGRVICVQLDMSLSRMAGLHIDCPFRGRRYIPAGQVRLLGEMAVLAKPEFVRAAPAPVLPRRALLPDGTHLGYITGAWLDENALCVESLELSGGILQDIFSGRIRVRLYHVQKENGDVIIEGQEAQRVPSPLKEGETV